MLAGESSQQFHEVCSLFYLHILFVFVVYLYNLFVFVVFKLNQDVYFHIKNQLQTSGSILKID